MDLNVTTASWNNIDADSTKNFTVTHNQSITIHFSDASCYDMDVDYKLYNSHGTEIYEDDDYDTLPDDYTFTANCN